MGKDVRALFLDRELAADFVAIDVSVLRLQSLSTQVPPWDFREEVGRPMEVSQEGVPQWRCCFDDRCEARFESIKAPATDVLRHHRQMETVSRLVLTNRCPVCLAVYADRKAAHRHLLSSRCAAVVAGGDLEKVSCQGEGLLGPEAGDETSIVILNRVLEWRNGRTAIEADPRHVELILQEMGTQSCKGREVMDGAAAKSHR